MNIAICISGALRDFKTCYPNFKQYVLDANKEHHVDIFVHTWDMRLPYTKIQIPDEGSFEEMEALYKPLIAEREVYNQALRDRLYKESGADRFQKEVKDMKLPVRKDGRWAQHTRCDVCGKNGSMGGKCRICGSTNIHNQLGMLYSVREAFDMVPTDYDVVCRTRFDLWYKEPLKIVAEDSKVLYLPDNGERDFQDYSIGDRSPNDQLSISSPAVMAVYCSQFDNFYELAMTGIRLGCGIGVPHLSIKTSANNNGIQLIYLPYRYCLQRKR